MEGTASGYDNTQVMMDAAMSLCESSVFNTPFFKIFLLHEMDTSDVTGQIESLKLIVKVQHTLSIHTLHAMLTVQKMWVVMVHPLSVFCRMNDESSLLFAIIDEIPWLLLHLLHIT